MKRILTHICDDLIAYDHVWSGRLDLNSFSGQLRIGKDSKAKEREKEDTAEPLQKDHPDERPPHLCLIYRVVFKEEFHCTDVKSHQTCEIYFYISENSEHTACKPTAQYSMRL